MVSLASSTRPSQPTPMTVDLEAKVAEINLVLSEPEVDLWRLRELALTEGGLVNDTLRKRAWPKLVGLHGDIESDENARPRTRSHVAKMEAANSSGLVARCVDADQIDRDVARCTWHLLTGSQRSRRLQMENKHRKKVSNLLSKKQRRLENLINLTLLQTDDPNAPDEDRLRYYQGYHDVACIFLHALGGGGSGPVPASFPDSWQGLAASMGLDLPARVLGQVSRSHFRDAMRSNFRELQIALRLVMFPLLAALDPELHDHLYDCDMEPFFALSWILTWFSHDVRDTAVVKRLFDAFLVSHPLFCIYMSIAMVLHPVNRTQVLQTDCDFASVHQTLLNLPKNSCMVGWTYKPHEDYMSGEEDMGDDGTLSTDMDAASFVSEDVAVTEGQFLGDETSETTSLLSIPSQAATERVPFQELIDAAVSYMRRIPPRRLMGLARRYYADEEHMLRFIDQSSLIALFQPPPKWGLASTAPADWVLKQRARERRGLKATNRRDRRNRAKVEQVSDIVSQEDDNDERLERYLEEKKRTLAVIASGVGKADDEEEERRKKRRKLMLYSGIALGIVALSCVVVLQYRPSTVGRAIPPESGTTSRELVASRESSSELTKPAQQTTTNSETRFERQESSLKPVRAKNRSKVPIELPSPKLHAEKKSHQRNASSEPMPPKDQLKDEFPVIGLERSKNGSEMSVGKGLSEMKRTETSTTEPKQSAMAEKKVETIRKEEIPDETVTAGENFFAMIISRVGGHSARPGKEAVISGSLAGVSARTITWFRQMGSAFYSAQGAFTEEVINKLQGSHFVQDIFRNVSHAIQEKDPERLPGFHSLHRISKDAFAAIKDFDIRKIPGFQKLGTISNDAAVALKERDVKRLPGFQRLRAFFSDAFTALKEKNMTKMPGNKAVGKLMSQARESLGENESEVVVL